MTTTTWKRCLAVLFAGALTVTGCSGDTGAQGPKGDKGDKGDTGDKGDPGQPPVSLVERCDGCHNGVAAKHATRGIVTVSEEALVAPVATDNDLKIRFNVKTDGVNDNRFLHVAGGYWWARNAVTGYGVRTTIDLVANPITVVNRWNGDYEATIAGFGPNVRDPDFAPGTTFLIRVDDGNAPDAATVVVHLGGADNLVVSNVSCTNCHGDKVFREPEGPESADHHGVSPRGVEACVVCHDRWDSAGPGLGVVGADPSAISTGGGSRLMGYVHGIHNSHNMPGGQASIRWDPDRVSSSNNGPLPEDWYTATVPAGTYLRTVTGAKNPNNDTPPVPLPSSTFSIGFPSYVNNCGVCHNTPATLARVQDNPPTWRLCMSCHQSWDGFSATVVGGAQAGIHRSITAATATLTTCTACHIPDTDDTLADPVPDRVAEFHNGARTARGGLIWDGADQSVVLGGTIVMSITDVAVSGTNLVVTWSATLSGAAVDPCNATVSTTAPVFFGATADAATGQVNSNMTILRSYAIGNDWVGGPGTSPGQPGSAVTVSSTNTTCAANVATTTIPLETTTATKGVVAIQGKPQIAFGPTAGTTSAVIQVRSPSPAREFVVATGEAPTVTRRKIVDFEKCETCHLGSMYQHGGNRVDSIELCVMCHNPAANEKNNRVNMGVSTAEAYDGQVGQSYDLRTMVHAIHSAGEAGSGEPLVFYRTNGIYFFGSKEALAERTDWPGTGCQVVSGSGAPSSATGTQCDAANTTAVTKNHNFVEVHYPRALADCNACHVDGSVDEMPNPTLAVAVTLEDAGAAPWGDLAGLADDVLVGPSAASCMSCHQSRNPVQQFIFRTHAYSNGILPGVIEGGRQALIDAVAP
jgi:hypothetical protein